MKYTTLREIREQHPCGLERGSREGWDKLLTYLGKEEQDEEPLALKTILDSNGIRDAVWSLHAFPYKDHCLFQADIADLVIEFIERELPGENRPRQAIEAVRKWHRGDLSDKDLCKACKAASDCMFDSKVDARISSALYVCYSAAHIRYSEGSAYCTAFAAGQANETLWAKIETLFLEYFCGE